MKRLVTSLAITGLMFGSAGLMQGCDRESTSKSTYSVDTPQGEHKVEVKKTRDYDENTSTTKIEKKTTNADGDKIEVEKKVSTSKAE